MRILTLIVYMCASLSVFAQDPEPVDGPIGHLAVKRFSVTRVADDDEPGVVKLHQDFTWYRPKNVEWVLLTGCGGGGGGATGSAYTPGGFAGGEGGSGSLVATHLVGPLTDHSYHVRVGAGGQGALFRRGVDSSGPGNVQMSFPGIAGGNTTFRSENIEEVENVNLLSLTFFGAPGGRHKVQGSVQASVSVIAQTEGLPLPDMLRFARGGQPAPNYNPAGDGTFGSAGTTTGTPAHSGGGGGAGYGPGGNGGAATQDGHHAESLCAGGGGSGMPYRLTANELRGGNGGDGFLVLLPLVDVARVEEKVQSMLRRLEQYESGNEE
ncbi:MAG: hypothetical protein AAF351_12690 [Pseudomonadota bacterium]